MAVPAVRITVLLTSILGVISSDKCLLEKQPFQKEVSLGQVIGRWYMHERLTTDNTPSYGGLVDAYDENGKIFGNFTTLEANGDCGMTLSYHAETMPDNPSRQKTYMGGVHVTDSYVVGQTPGGTEVRFWCTLSDVKDGVCVSPRVDVWSRNPTISALELAAANIMIEQLCLPDKMYRHKSVAFGRCKEEEPNSKTCETQFVPYMNRFNPLKAIGRWHLTAWYFTGENGPSEQDMLGLTVDIQRQRDQNVLKFHYANSIGCSKLPPSVWETTAVNGKVVLLGTYNNGSTSYIVDTDYKSFLVMWVCLGPLEDTCHNPTVELWSRLPIASPVTLRRTKRALKYLCNANTEYLFQPAAYHDCPERKKEVPKCTCEKSRASTGEVACMPLLLVTYVISTVLWSYFL